MASELTAIEQTIRDFLLQELLYDKQLADLGPQQMLLENSLLDSIGILQIVAFCEQTFDIAIPEEELIPDHFENVRAIGGLVEQCLAEKRAPR
jgi:acyl carrier protein